MVEGVPAKGKGGLYALGRHEQIVTVVLAPPCETPCC